MKLQSRHVSATLASLGAMLLLAAFSSNASQHAPVDADRALQIEQACLKTNRDYQYHRDRGNVEAYAALFTEDAEFLLASPVRGREAIAAAMAQRFAQQRSRHFTNVVQLNATSSNSAEGLVYLLLFRGPQDAVGPVPIDGIDLVAEYHDQYVMADNRCLIRQRRVQVVFTRR